MVVIALLTPLFLVGLVSSQVKRAGLIRELRALRGEVSGVGRANEELRSFLEYFSLRASLEREARSRLNLAKPGETLIIFVEPTPTPQLAKEKSQTLIQKITHWAQELF